jgi:hypothetical protein
MLLRATVLPFMGDAQIESRSLNFDLTALSTDCQT